jgi:purine nucleoside phosphorylase
VYDANLNDLLRRAARRVRVRLHRGTYIAVSGPSYETPAEIRAFARLGADAVGMSTVPEAIVAHQCRIQVAALSCITNLAAGRNKKPLSHSEVLAVGDQVRSKTIRLLTEFVRLIAKTN